MPETRARTSTCFEPSTCPTMSNRMGTRLGSTLAICTGTADGAAAAARDAASSLPHAASSATVKSASTQCAAAIDARRRLCTGVVFLLGDMSGESLEKQGRVRRAPRAIIAQTHPDRRRGAVPPHTSDLVTSLLG